MSDAIQRGRVVLMQGGCEEVCHGEAGKAQDCV